MIHRKKSYKEGIFMSRTEKNFPHCLKIYAIATAVLTGLSVLLRCINLFLFLEPEIGYYDASAVLPIAERILLTASVLFFAGFSIACFRRCPIQSALAPKKSTRMASLCTAVLFLVFAVLCVIQKDNSALLPRLLLLLSVIAAVYFLIHGGQAEIPALPRVVTGCAVILWLLLALASSYFEETVPMNAPDKIIFQLACLGGMIFVVEEMRSFFQSLRPALYLFSASCASLLLGSAAIPSLIGGFCGVLPQPSWFLCHFILAGMFVYTFVAFLTQVRTAVTSPASEEPMQTETADDTPTQESEPNRESPNDVSKQESSKEE